ESTDMVLQQDAISRQELTRESGRLSGTNGAEGFGERCLFVRHASRFPQLCQTQRPTLRRGNVAKHAHKQVLHELEARNWPSELLAAGRVGERVLVCAHGTADRCHATPARVMRSTAAVSLNEVARASRLLSGTRQSSSEMSAFWTTRSAILPSIF